MSSDAHAAVLANPSLPGFRKLVTPNQQSLLDLFWKYYCEHDKWYPTRWIHSSRGRDNVVESLRPLTGNVVSETDSSGVTMYELSLLGVLLTTDGEELECLLTGYFEFQREMYRKSPERAQANANDIAEYLKLAPDQLKKLGLILRAAHLGGGPTPSWSVSALREADTYPQEGSLSSVTRDLVFRYFKADAPILRAERDAQRAWTPILTYDEPFRINTPRDAVKADGDPLKRRYQVFVSSTYSDLIEERKHVMQALLVTKCIPSGMELFPAASMEQWKLIQQVIDDCDYYIVIAAGKYGSIGPNGKSYTEMEFDYAASRGKPVLGFFHSDIKKLSGERLEEDEKRRLALAKFTEKIRSKMCHAWNSPEGLASAIKTSILHAIETNPKPGWVRADSVPTWTMVKNLETRIAELEGRSRAEQRDLLPSGEETISLPVRIRWYETDDPKRTYPHERRSFDRVFELTWDEILEFIGPKPGTSTSRLGLMRAFTHSLAQKASDEVNRRAKKSIKGLHGTIEGTLFDQIIQTLLAKKLLKNTRPPNSVRSRALYWQLAPKGIQRLAELRAVRSGQ